MLQTNCSNTVNRPRYLNSATPRHHRRAWAIEACLIASLPVTFAVGWSVREKWSVLARSSSTHPWLGQGSTPAMTGGVAGDAACAQLACLPPAARDTPATAAPRLAGMPVADGTMYVLD